MRPVLRLLLLFACVLALHACSLFTLQRHSLPVEASQLGGGLASGYELHAVLTVARDGIKQEYLMALQTQPGAVRLALMTPQGLPIYVVSGSGGAIAVEQQLHSAHLLTPDIVACYLLMVYGDSELLAESAANHDWQLEITPGGGRIFRRKEAVEAIEVSYLGEAPWYREVAIRDGQDNTRVKIRTLEWFDAVPE